MKRGLTVRSLLRSEWFGGLAICLFGFALYARTLGFDLTYFDDNWWLREGNWRNLPTWDIFSFLGRKDQISDVFYRPLLNISFFLNSRLMPQALWPYHLTNLVFHVLNCCLFLALLRRLGLSRRMALTGALFLVAHPLAVQAVAWIPGRTETLVAGFTLLSMICLLDCLKEHRWGAYVGHQIFFLAALLSKEVAVVIPILGMMYIVLVQRKKWFDSETLCFKAGWLMVTAFWLGMRCHALHGIPGLGTCFDLENFKANLPAITYYFGKTLWSPAPVVLPGREHVQSVVGILVAVLVVVLSCFRGRGDVSGRERRLAWFGLGWFLLFILPGLPVATFFFEYRAYVSLMGIILAGACLAPVRWLEGRPTLFWTFVAGGIVISTLISVNYIPAYRDRGSFWEGAVKGSPRSAFAQNSLGAIYFLDGKFEQAKECYNRAISINPREPMIHNNLGLIAVRQGNVEEALKDYQIEIEINPNFQNVYLNLGALYDAVGRYEQAEKAWVRAVELDPGNLNAVKTLEDFYLRRGKFSHIYASQGSGWEFPDHGKEHR